MLLAAQRIGNLKAWLERHPHAHVHFLNLFLDTPTSVSSLNRVECCFRSTPELISIIEDYVAVPNQNPKPFGWTAKAHVNRQLGSKKNEALY